MTSALVMPSNIRHAGQSWTVLTLRSTPIVVTKSLKQSPAKVSDDIKLNPINSKALMSSVIILTLLFLFVSQATTMRVRCSSVSVTVRLLNALLYLNIMRKQEPAQ